MKKVTVLKWLKNIGKLIACCFLAIFLIIAVFLVKGFFFCSILQHPLVSYPKVHVSSAMQQAQDHINGYTRPQDSTYLIYPEWYIVYSSTEYADFLKEHRPSQFPYFSAIEQYWCSYHTVLELTKAYPFNWGDNIMLMVIGLSLSLEYTIEGLYEHTVGRITEWLSDDKPVEEDIYAQKVAQQYAEFIPFRPWFEFPFSKSLTGLWCDTSWYGPHMVRKWERKLYLSAQYLIKTVYAKIIGAGSHSTYGAASDYVYTAYHTTSPKAFQNASNVIKTATVDPNNYILALPHEQPFTQAALSLVNTQSQFINIAGNNSILLTVVAPKNWGYPLNRGKVLFVMTILTQPSKQRVGIQMPVDSLLDLLAQLQKEPVFIEHLYDF